jgi:hypothetical protein
LANSTTFAMIWFYEPTTVLQKTTYSGLLSAIDLHVPYATSLVMLALE